MQRMNFDQQVNVFNPALARPVTIIGVGSVGSALAMVLAKEGCSDITVWDGDEVASHNVPMSEYWPEDIMRLKVEALADKILKAAGLNIIAIPKMYNGEPLKTAVAACVDTMEGRKLIWSQTKQNPFVELFVDTRIAAEYIEVFAIRPCNPEDIEYYEHFLYPSKDAALLSCGSHGAKHVSGTAANAACAALTGWWKSDIFKRHLKMLCGHFQEIV